jgi:hypothetical protein
MLLFFFGFVFSCNDVSSGPQFSFVAESVLAMEE